MIYSEADIKRAVAAARRYIEHCDEEYADSLWRSHYAGDDEFYEKVTEHERTHLPGSEAGSGKTNCRR